MKDFLIVILFASLFLALLIGCTWSVLILVFEIGGFVGYFCGLCLSILILLTFFILGQIAIN